MSDRQRLADFMVKPWQALKQAIKEIPATKYFLGVVGLAGAAIIIGNFFAFNWLTAFLACVIVFFGAVAIIFLQRITSLRPKNLYVPTLVIIWPFVISLSLIQIFLLTSFFFGLPLDMRPERFSPDRKITTNSQNQLESSSNQNPVKDTEPYFGPKIPFNVGWIFVGYYDPQKKTYIKGPFTEIVLTHGQGNTDPKHPDKGDILHVVNERNIIIANFKNEGQKNIFISPPLIKGILTDEDYTGVIIPPGKLVQVEDVTFTHFPGQPYAIWCLISACNWGNPQCEQAASRMEEERKLSRRIRGESKWKR